MNRWMWTPYRSCGDQETHGTPDSAPPTTNLVSEYMVTDASIRFYNQAKTIGFIAPWFYRRKPFRRTWQTMSKNVPRLYNMPKIFPRSPFIPKLKHLGFLAPRNCKSACSTAENKAGCSRGKTAGCPVVPSGKRLCRNSRRSLPAWDSAQLL